MGQVVICQPTANFSFTPIFHSRKISFQTSSLLDLCILWQSPLAFIWSWIWFQKSSRKEKYFSSRRSFFSREVQQVAESSGSSTYTLFASWQLGRYQNWSPTADICWSYFQFQPAAGIPLQAMTTKQEKETTVDASLKQWHLFPYFDENGDTYFQYLLCYTNCHPIIIAVHLSSREPIFALDCRLLLSHQSCQKYHLRNISREIPHLLPGMATDCHIEKIENRVVEEQTFAK